MNEILSSLHQRNQPKKVDVKLNIPSILFQHDELVNANKENSIDFLLQLKKRFNLYGLDIPGNEDYNDNDDDYDDDDYYDDENKNNDDDSVQQDSTPQTVRINNNISKPIKLNVGQVDLKQLDEGEMNKIFEIQEELRTQDKPKTKKKRKTVRDKELMTSNIYFSGIDDDEELMSKFDQYTKDKTKLNVSKNYTLNNRYMFLNKIRSMLINMNFKMEKGKTCEDQESSVGFVPLSHQLLVKRYLNSYTPYRGLLLFHGLGSGKTCTSIGIMEGMKFDKKVFIMTPASLRKNYKTQMKFCGDQVYRDNNFWVKYKVPLDDSVESKSTLLTLTKITSFDKNTLRKMKHVYLVDQTEKQSNYHEFSREEQLRINKQIEMMIDRKYEYISYNGISEKLWLTNYKKNKSNPFTNSVVIIDEAHNFVSRVINKLNIEKESVSTMIYESLLSAENCKIVMLSGTPMINYPCEMGVLFNIIGGYNYCINFELAVQPGKESRLSPKYLNKLLEKNKSVDYIEINPTEKNVVRVVRNPYNFVRNKDGVTFDNVRGSIPLKKFKRDVERILVNDGYKILKSTLEKFKKFPDTEASFNEYFIKNKNQFTNKERFQNKILGMVSYLGDRKEMMPRVVVPETFKEGDQELNEIFVEEIPMTEYILMKYNDARGKEVDQETNKRKIAELKKLDITTSSYRVFSRCACNFVFPEFIEKPVIEFQKGNTDDMEVTEDDMEVMTEQEMMNDVDGKYDENDVKKMKRDKSKLRYIEDIRKAIQSLYDNRGKIFNSDLPFFVNKEVIYRNNESETNVNEEAENTETNNSNMTKYFQSNSLKKYSPKFYKLLSNLLTENLDVCNLMYSNFRTLEGIGIFKMALEFHGYTQLRIIKDVGGNLDVSFKHPYYSDEDFDSSKPRKFFSLYTGTETVEQKEIIRNIYNNNFDKIPIRIREKLQEQFGELTNLHGEIINLLIISASGAEGIDLKNVRNVHILEPYWHPVRIEQVIGRARRICSHSTLPEDERDVKIYMYIMTHNRELINSKKEEFANLVTYDTDSETNKLLTTDEALYKKMKDKKRLSNEILNSLKEASIDCIVNYENKSKCMHVNFTNEVVSKINYVDEGSAVELTEKQGKEKPLYSYIVKFRKRGRVYKERELAINVDNNIAYEIQENPSEPLIMHGDVIPGDLNENGEVEFYYYDSNE